MTDKELAEMMHKYQAEQREAEVVWFYRQAEKTNPKVIVEIGIKEGGNLKILSTLLPEDGLAIGIDPRKEIPWKMNDAACQVFHISEDSHKPETIEKLTNLLAGKPIDVLFIDGDHSYEGMLRDYHDYGPLVRDGGIIAVHDIFYLDDVMKAWAAIPSLSKIESPRNQSSIGIGCIRK